MKARERNQYKEYGKVFILCRRMTCYTVLKKTAQISWKVVRNNYGNKK